MQHLDEPPVKPRLRGMFHLLGFVLVPVGAFELLRKMPERSAAPAILIYVGCMALMFGVSAAYHVPHWKPDVRRWWRRVDHAAIFALIYGTYVPICGLGLHRPLDGRFMVAVAGTCLLGAILELFTFRHGRTVRIVLCVGLGWVGLTLLPAMNRVAGTSTLVLFCAGGVVYTLGAAVYGFKRPNPWPRTFGYHEVFHVLVLIACFLQFLAVARIVEL